MQGTNQVRNSAGGYTYQLDKFDRLERFLILGCEGGTYYATERKLTIENANCVLNCAKVDPQRTVDTIVEISESGRAIKNDPAIFALAILASNGKLDENVALAAKLALDAMPRVCRTGTHFFDFVNVCNELRGWGRAFRRAVSNWYLTQHPEKLAMAVTKYAQRNGWSHRDVLRLCHAKATNRATQDILQYVAQPDKWTKARRVGKSSLLLAVEAAKKATTVHEIVSLILEYGLVREHIPTHFLNEKDVWEALLCKMPPTAMLRSLGKMTSIDLLKPLSYETKVVCDMLRDGDMLKQAREHPFSVLLAFNQYNQGHGLRGSLSWRPVPQILEALNDAFDLSFAAVEPTGKRFMLGIDVSGSMGMYHLAGTSIQARTAAACMAMVTMRTEEQSYAFGFHHRFQELGLSPSMRLDEVTRKIHSIQFGSTDCAIPMNYAMDNRIEADAFVCYTDSETYRGPVHPSVALEQYRQRTGIDAKLICVGLTATEFTIADPADMNSLNVVGFDANGPAAISEFVREPVVGRRKAG